MKFSDIEVLVKHLSDPIKKYVSNLVNPINKKIESLEDSLNSIKAIDVDDIALTAAGLIDKPKDGSNGKSFLDQLSDLGFKNLDEFLESIKGKDGEDGKSFIEVLNEKGFKDFDSFKASLKGQDAEPAIDGKSAYQIALERGFIGDVDQWLLSLVGLNGKSFLEQLPDLGFKDFDEFKSQLKGERGDKGNSFIDEIEQLGFNNLDSFIKSLKGEKGDTGKSAFEISKDNNKSNEEIEWLKSLNGQDGENGKNALDIDILPEINESETYQRGTYATHNGGLWRSHQTTKGLRGWECIVNGISEVEIEQVDERNFKLKLTKSDNNVIEKSLSMPVMIYQGVFKSGESYQKGDTVTWGGSMWHCDADTSDKPGELESKCWTLATKRGRDGKDKQ